MLIQQNNQAQRPSFERPQHVPCRVALLHEDMRLVRVDPLSFLLFCRQGGGCGDNGVSLSPCMAHVRPTFLLPTPHPGRTMPGLFTDPLRPLSSMGRPSLMMAPNSQQGVIQKSTSLQPQGQNLQRPPSNQNNFMRTEKCAEDSPTCLYTFREVQWFLIVISIWSK